MIPGRREDGQEVREAGRWPAPLSQRSSEGAKRAAISEVGKIGTYI